jgi:hypothetical protein
MKNYWHVLRGLLICAVIGLSFYATHLLGRELVILLRPKFEVQGELLLGALWLGLALYYVVWGNTTFSD